MISHKMANVTKAEYGCFEKDLGIQPIYLISDLLARSCLVHYTNFKEREYAIYSSYDYMYKAIDNKAFYFLELPEVLIFN